MRALVTKFGGVTTGLRGGWVALLLAVSLAALPGCGRGPTPIPAPATATRPAPTAAPTIPFVVLSPRPDAPRPVGTPLSVVPYGQTPTPVVCPPRPSPFHNEYDCEIDRLVTGPQPTAVVLAEVAGQAVAVRWAGVEPHEGEFFTIYRQQFPAGAWEWRTAVPRVPSREDRDQFYFWRDTTVAPGTAYRYAVETFDRYGERSGARGSEPVTVP